MIETKITLTIKHTRPLPDLCDLVAGRAYTLSHVEDVTAKVVDQTQGVPIGFVSAPVESTDEMLDPGTDRQMPRLERRKLCLSGNARSSPETPQPPKPSPNEWVLE